MKVISYGPPVSLNIDAKVSYYIFSTILLVRPRPILAMPLTKINDEALTKLKDLVI